MWVERRVGNSRGQSESKANMCFIIRWGKRGMDQSNQQRPVQGNFST